jgi:hypothetical protein
MNYVIFSEELQEATVIARTRLSSLATDAYKDSFLWYLRTIDRDAQKMEAYLEYLEMIMMDFSEAQCEGLKLALIQLFGIDEGLEIYDRLRRGCEVHFLRSVKRVAILATDSKEEQTVFEGVCKKINRVKSLAQAKEVFTIMVQLYPGVYYRQHGGPVMIFFLC